MNRMQCIARNWMTAGTLIWVAACSTSQNHVDRAANVDARAYKTYRWVSQDDAQYLSLSNPNTNQPVYNYVKITQRPQAEEQIKQVVEQDLNQQGYTQELSGTPDFFVTYYAPARDKDWISSWTGSTLSFRGAPLVIFPGFDMTKAQQFRPGMAYVVIYDSKTKQPAWTGTIMDAISPEGKVNAPQVTASVNDLLSQVKKPA
ncbi:MAG: DUF4136 domain-containing protein [Bdellovibrionia bacterium]